MNINILGTGGIFGVFLKLLIGLFGFGLLGGCSILNKQPQLEPIQATTNAFLTEVIKPAVEKIGNETSARTAQLQGQGSLINPGYKVNGYAGLFQGLHYDFTVTTVGVSANLAGAAQADQGQAADVPPPAIRPSLGKIEGLPAPANPAGSSTTP